MQKRHARGRDTLPMTAADATNPGHSPPGIHRRRRKRRLNPNIFLFCKVAALCIGGLVLYKKFGNSRPTSEEQSSEERSSAGKRHNHRAVEDTSSNLEKGANKADELSRNHLTLHHHQFETSGGGEPPLAQFKSLSYALANADLVGLYFAASWCPMSTPVTVALAEAFSDKPGILLPPPGSANDGGEKRAFALVYVSSDNSEESMMSYSRNGWINVPYDSNDRSGIKKHFRVCAKKELEELGFERKFEIPTLIIVDSVSHGIVTTSGVSDLKEFGGEKALKVWVGLQKQIRELEDKYEGEAKERQKRPEPRIV